MKLQQWFSLVKDERLKQMLYLNTPIDRLEYGATDFANAISTAFGWSIAQYPPPDGYHYDLPKSEKLGHAMSDGWRMVYYLALKNKIPMDKIPTATEVIKNIKDPVTRSAIREILKEVCKKRPSFRKRYYESVKVLIKDLAAYIPEENTEYRMILDALYKANLEE